MLLLNLQSPPPPIFIMTKKKQLITEFKINLIFPYLFHYLSCEISDFCWEKRFWHILDMTLTLLHSQLFSE